MIFAGPPGGYFTYPKVRKQIAPVSDDTFTQPVPVGLRAEAQTKAIESIKEGVSGRAVHQIAARVIDSSRFKGGFTHGLGHSLGLEVDDGPGLTLRNSARLKRDMVVTVEPGIYLPGEGGVRN